MFKREFMILTDIGKIIGKTSHDVGHWLIELGYRTKDKKPSQKALDEGLVQEHLFEGHPNWNWHAERTVKVLEDAGHYRVINPPIHLFEQPTIVGPFSVRNIGENTFQIVSVNGAVAVIVSGEHNAKQMRTVMEAGHRLGMFSKAAEVR